MTQEQIRNRNWQKARLIGMTFDHFTLMPEELGVVGQILGLRAHLLADWDSQTEIFVGHPLKPHKCWMCGRRSNIPHIHPNDLHNYCLKHYKLFTNGERRESIALRAEAISDRRLQELAGNGSPSS